MTTILDVIPIVWEQPSSQPQGVNAEVIEMAKEEQDSNQVVYLNWSEPVLTYVIEVIKQLCLKYVENDSDATIEYILRKMGRVGERLAKLTGAREFVAAVVYCQYSGVIRLKLKDYCDMNQLNRKLFNKKYVAYQTFLKKTNFTTNTHTGNQTKLDQKDPVSSKPMDEGQQKRQVRSKKEAIQLIYDGIFKSIYFQDNRREIIEKMAQRCEEIDQRVFTEMTFTNNHTLKLYYAIFLHLKNLGIQVNFTKYRQAVANSAGLHFKRSHAIIAARIFKKMEELDRQESIDSCSSTLL